MANNKDAFEERLKRLGANTPSTSSAPTEHSVETPKLQLDSAAARKRTAGGGNSAAFAFLAIAILLIGGGAFATMAFAPELIFSSASLP
jgi:hypothetical protein